jgi:hypothetical protein
MHRRPDFFDMRPLEFTHARAKQHTGTTEIMTREEDFPQDTSRKETAKGRKNQREWDGKTETITGLAPGPLPRPARGAQDVVCASTAQQVERAWGLVYDRYIGLGLIPPNQLGIHTTPLAVGAHACVIWGGGQDRSNADDGALPQVGYTMTLMEDQANGLPLDTVYPQSLNLMRVHGRSLMEIGLLAERGEGQVRSMGGLFSMMRMALSYSLYAGATDILVGVHPHHATFYKKRYGFSEFASATTHPLVRNKPVIGLRLPLREMIFRKDAPKGITNALKNRTADEVFANRFSFEPKLLRASKISDFLVLAKLNHRGKYSVKKSAIAG